MSSAWSAAPASEGDRELEASIQLSTSEYVPTKTMAPHERQMFASPPHPGSPAPTVRSHCDITPPAQASNSFHRFSRSAGMPISPHAAMNSFDSLICTLASV